MSLPPQTPITTDVRAEPLAYAAAAKEAAPGVVRNEAAQELTDERAAAAAGRAPWRATLGTVAVYAVLVVGAVAMLVPFAWMLAASLTDAATVAAGETGPMVAEALRDPKRENYRLSLEAMGMQLDANADGRASFGELVRLRFPAVSNTIVVTVLCILGQTISSSLVGYGFARFNVRGRPFLFLLMLSTMMLPYQVTMIPVFVMFRWAGMIDTFWPLILPQWFASPFFAFMFRQFFAQVPEELTEAARIDGAGHFTIYWRMMLPLSGPVVAIVAIFTFMTTWNDFLAPLIYLNSPENRTLALALNAFNGQYGIANANLLMAASFVAMLPCIVLFFAAQRYFVDNAATSGLKG